MSGNVAEIHQIDINIFPFNVEHVPLARPPPPPPALPLPFPHKKNTQSQTPHRTRPRSATHHSGKTPRTRIRRLLAMVCLPLSLSPSPPHLHPSRTRKTRCDGAKPACHNCTRRAKQTDPCLYDTAPKRRGPDKTPGARQRMAREALQECETDAVASRRRRRKRHDTASPPPQPQLRPPPTSPTPLPPLKQPSLVLDPQLADMPPFRPTPAASTPPLPPGSSLTGSASFLSDPLPVLPDALYHMTTSQVLTRSLIRR